MRSILPMQADSHPYDDLGIVCCERNTSIAELCRREGIAEGLYYAWSKEFLEAGKRRLAGDTARAATSGEVKALRREAQELKAVVAEQALELRLLKKSMIADGGDEE
jgi:transposase